MNDYIPNQRGTNGSSGKDNNNGTHLPEGNSPKARGNGDKPAQGFIPNRHENDFDEDLQENTTHEAPPKLGPEEEEVYRKALMVLNECHVNYTVGAAFARYVYTGIWRMTKDLDIYVKPEDLKTTLDCLNQAGFVTYIEFEHWLAKARKGKGMIDLIFGTGHGQLPIDDAAFVGSQEAEVLGVKTRLIPIEEMIAAACYVAERRRFDGAEATHLIHSVQGKLDWQRILRRLGNNRELLLWQLIMFDFVYPGHPDYLPQDLMVQLFDETRKRWSRPGINPKAFRGTLLDPFSFTVDVEDWGYEDRRNLSPLVNEEGNPL